jgi:prepilin-type N-terminal cleavage/methylation domain-containing protein
MKLKFAFTLAEVLIVLGIIGIIAEMTIPTLIDNVNNTAYIVGLKKELSILNQAYLSLKADNGGTIKGLCTTNDSDCLGNLFKPYLRYTSIVTGVPSVNSLANCWDSTEILNTGEQHDCFSMADGTVIDFDEEYGDCNTNCGITYIDVNGRKKPNVWGKDRYLFYIYDDNIAAYDAGAGGCNDGKGNVWTANISCAFKYLYQNGN